MYEKDVVFTIIESIKVAAPLCAVLMSFLIWREQKRNQIEQGIMNAQTQKDIAQLNAENNAALKEREFELKFYEELIKQRLNDYDAAKKNIAKHLIVRKNFNLADLNEIIEDLNAGLDRVVSLEKEVFDVWIDTCSVLIEIHGKAIKSEDRDNFVLERLEKVQFYLAYLMSCINHGVLSLNNLEKLKEDTRDLVKNFEEQGKNKGILSPGRIHFLEEIEREKS